MSVAYGNQRAGVGGVELSLGGITHSGNTICGCRADSRVNLTGVALKNIKVPGEDMAATVRSPQAFEAMEPFERLNKARSPTM
jgi:hypothetical protein